MNAGLERNADLIWQTGVVKTRAGRAWLEFDDPGACGRCSRGRGCGAALFSRLFSRPPTVIALDDADLRTAGKRVRAGLSAHWVMLAAAALYLVPVIAFLAGALAADTIWPRDDLAALCGGLLAGFGAVGAIRKRLRCTRPPRLELVELDAGLESRAGGDHLRWRDT